MRVGRRPAAHGPNLSAIVLGLFIVDSWPSAPRIGGQQSAFVILSGKKLECTARNISKRGAPLRLSNFSDLPRSVYVEIDGYRRRCCVIWRRDKEIGIRF